METVFSTVAREVKQDLSESCELEYFEGFL